MSKKAKATKAIQLVSKPAMDTGIKATSRAKMAQKMGEVLASNYVLALKTQNYHWNVTGMHFQSLHALFELQYTEISATSDLLAERIRALGFFAPATFREFAKLSFVKEDTTAPANAEAMVANLLADHETMVRECRKALDFADEIDDDVSEGMLAERCDYHEKTAWMLRATLGK